MRGERRTNNTHERKAAQKAKIKNQKKSAEKNKKNEKNKKIKNKADVDAKPVLNTCYYWTNLYYFTYCNTNKQMVKMQFVKYSKELRGSLKFQHLVQKLVSHKTKKNILSLKLRSTCIDARA